MHRTFLPAAVAAAYFIFLVATSSAAAAPPPGVATFDGQQISLAGGWGGAQACFVYRGAAECFSNRAEMAAREDQMATQNVVTPSVASASCGTPLRLFAESNYGGRELDFYDRGYWQNLSTWGFDNQLSSYRAGSCGVYLADGANGGGSWYPGSTAAGHSEASMASGWNDRISSIFIQ